MGERVRGAVLYACAVALLAAGGVWWFRAAPRQEADPQIERWKQSALRLLPDVDAQEHAGTLALPAGIDREVTAEIDPGEYAVSVVCVGGAESQVRVSLGETGYDSGLGLTCAGDNRPDNFRVTVANPLRMNVSVNNAGPVVFRYSLLRAGT
jgi:hypothetical protein